MTMLPPAAPPHVDLSKQQDQKFENCVEEEEEEEGGYGGYSYNYNNTREREGFGGGHVHVMSRVEVQVEGYYNYKYKCCSNENINICTSDQNIIAVEVVSRSRSRSRSRSMGDQDQDQDQEEGRISRSNSVSVSLNEAGGSSSKGTFIHQQDKDEGSWLQLGIPSHQTLIHHHNHKELPLAPIPTTPLVELDLLPPPHPPLNSDHQACSRPVLIHAQAQARAQAQAHPALEIRGAALMSYPAGSSFCASNLLFQQTPTTGGPAPVLHHHHQDSSSTWAFGPIPYSSMGMGMGMGMEMGLMPPPPSSSSSLRTSTLPLHSHPHHHHLASYFPRPFHFPQAFDEAGLIGPGPGPSSDIRVVDPPRRPHSGIWFMLQASPTQAKEPFLPQIPKSYLRIKDGKMTVRLLLKYLVNKLKLDSESEIEIRCRGQQLVPLLTLEHVRDNIWSHRDAAMATTLLSESSSSTSDHIMVLHYGRSA